MPESNRSQSVAERAAAPVSKPGKAIDSGRGRSFPCDQCGADLEFSIGAQSLKCPYCGFVKQIELPADAPIVERDYQAMLQRLEQLREHGHVEDQLASNEHAICCESCGAEVIFQGTLTSTSCPYCASPLQRDKVHDAPSRIAVDGVLPFLVAEQAAAQNLRDWVRSLWWAPNDFLKQGANGKFNGVYLPYFTYDSLTFTRYAGQRGDHYYVTVGSGNNRRTERRTRWSYTDGEFQRFFDDVLVLAATGQSVSLVRGLEPWPLERCVPFTQELLAGLFARTYDVTLEGGFSEARQRMESAITTEVRQRIGGDVQNITSQQTSYGAITFKHLLLPVWLLVYRYREKTHRVMINAVTGEVSGERPYSAVKIACAVLFGLIIALVVWWMSQGEMQTF
jgi:DNA-directed RNA polymerase subunit RPC12/RpoP